MMNDLIKELAKQAGFAVWGDAVFMHDPKVNDNNVVENFTGLIVRECIDKIETHQIPVGNSAAGEMACEWTYAALKEIKDEIKEHFGVEE
jgi:hypothetical protein